MMMMMMMMMMMTIMAIMRIMMMIMIIIIIVVVVDYDYGYDYYDYDYDDAICFNIITLNQWHDAKDYDKEHRVIKIRNFKNFCSYNITFTQPNICNLFHNDFYLYNDRL